MNPLSVIKALCTSLLLVLLATLSSCSAKFSSTPYKQLDPSNLQKGVAYKLPRTQIEYHFHLALYRAIRTGTATPSYFVWLDELRYSENKDVVELTSKFVGDDDAVFVLNTQDLAKFNVWTKKSGFTLSEDGVLKAVNAEFEDRTAEIIKNSVSSTLRFAKLAANPIGLSDGRALDSPGAPSIERMFPVKISGIFDYRDVVSPTIGKTSFHFAVPTEDAVEFVAVKIGLGSDVNFPNITISFPDSKNFEKLSTSDARAALDFRPFPVPRKYSGVVVRQPNALIANVLMSGSNVARKSLLVADAGPTTLVPFSSKLFTARTQTATMHESGGINKFEFSTTSAGETASKTLDEVAETVGNEVPEIIQAEQIRADNRYKTTSEISTKSTEIRKLNSEISEYERRLKRLDEQDRALNSQVPPEGLDETDLASWRAENIAARRKISEETKQLKAEKQDKENALNQSTIDLNYLVEKLGRQ